MKLIRAYPVSFRTRFESEGNASAEVEKRLVADELPTDVLGEEGMNAQS